MIISCGRAFRVLIIPGCIDNLLRKRQPCPDNQLPAPNEDTHAFTRFPCPNSWDTALRTAVTLGFTICRVPKSWDTEFQPCPEHRDKDFRVPLATSLAISFESAIWQPLTNPKMPTQGSTCDHVITCMSRYPPGRSGQLACRGRGAKSQERVNLT